MTQSNSGGERLQKIIAQAGITSRRDAEELIREGRVTVNGKTAKLGDKATLGKDAIKVSGKLLQTTAHKVYYLFYKPKNVIAMITEDEEGRPTIKDFIHRIKERVFTIGRMDFTGEGAILLTNDGELAQRLQKSTDIIRRYHVKVDRHPTSEELARLARGGRIEGRSMQPFHIRVVETYNKNALIEISFEGMGSLEVRQYFENKGFHPEKVARMGIGHLKAEGIPPGGYKRIEGSSIEALFTQPELSKKQIERLVAKKSSKAKTMNEDELDRVAKGRKPKSNDSPTRAPARSSERPGARPARRLKPRQSDGLDENFRFSGKAAAPRETNEFKSRAERSGIRGARGPSRTERGFSTTREASPSKNPAKPTIRFRHSR